MALSLAYDPQLSRVQISADGLGGMAPVRVERSSDQVRWSTVRGGAAITPSGGLVKLDDYEFAANGPNFYRVVTPTAVDTFTRSVSGGWDMSDSGLPWSTSGGTSTDYSVTGTAGRHSLPAVSSSRRTLLAVSSEAVPVWAPQYTDVDVAVSIKVAVLAAGAPINPGLMIRQLDANNYYFAELALNTDQTVRVQLRKNVAGVLTTFAQPFVAGLAHSTTGMIRLRIQAIGQTLRCKAWLAGTGEPDWQATAVDSAFTGGAVGCRSSLTAGNTNTLPVAVDFDDFAVLSPTRVDTQAAVTTAASDTFGRTVSGGWGTSTSGHAWQTVGGVAGDFAVTGSAGTHSMTAINLTWRTLLPTSLQPRDADITWTVVTPAAVGGSIESSAMFRIDPANIGGAYLYAETEFKPGGPVQVRLLSRSASSDTPLAGPYFVPGLTHGAGVPFKIRAQVWDRIFRMKVWLAASAEPAGWTLTGDTDVVRAGRVGLRSTSDPTNTNTLPIVVTYDDVTVSVLDGVPVAPALDGVWLKSIARPFLNRPVTVVDYSDVERPSRAGVFDVIGRSYPVAVTDVRGSRRWTLEVLTGTAGAASDVDLLLASGDVLFVQPPAGTGVPGGYVVVGDSRQRRTSRLGARRVFELPCTEVAAPGADVVGATVTCQGVLNAYATCAAVLAAQPTCQSLMELIGSPTDVIVS